MFGCQIMLIALENNVLFWTGCLPPPLLGSPKHQKPIPVRSAATFEKSSPSLIQSHSPSTARSLPPIDQTVPFK